MSGRKNHWLWLTALVLTCAGGVALTAQEETPFPHTPHIEEGLECTTCHGRDEVTGKMKINKEACTDCHDEGAPAWTSRPAKRAPVRFSHTAHEGLECKDCHARTAADEQPRDEVLVSQKRCIECHGENDVEVKEAECARCHGVGPNKLVPPDHKHAWLTRHGKESQWRVFGRHGKDCAQCHSKDVCITCHTQQRPRSHTALWRMRTHGTAAAWDRGSCKTCHEPGTCIQCHTTTTPLNHTGGWLVSHGFAAGSLGNEKCAACHRLVRQCAECHSGR